MSSNVSEAIVTVTRDRLEEWINLDGKMDGYLLEYQGFRIKSVVFDENREPMLMLYVDLYEDQPN